MMDVDAYQWEEGGVASVCADVTQSESANDLVCSSIVQPQDRMVLLHRKYAD